MYTKLISDYIESKRDAFLADIAKLVAIPSVKGEATGSKPFGEKPAAALDEALNMCAESGLEVKNISNAIGYADMNDMPLELGILAHMDVVPAGDGWDTDPYSLVYKDGNIYGRGVSDDKGPALAALYAMKAIKELNIPLKKNVRLILGTDEENGSGDLKYYFDSYAAPHYSFSPDAEFPVINTEKGRFAPKFCAKTDDKDVLPRVVSFHGGVAVNAVPNEAVMSIKEAALDDILNICKSVSEKTGVTFAASKSDDTVCVKASGKAAHASTPDMGNNAVTAMLELIKNIDLPSCSSTKLFKGLAEVFPHGDTVGRAIGIEMSDTVSGSLTATLDVLHFDGDMITGFFDSRVPICAEKNSMIASVKNALADKGFDIAELNFTEPHHVDENSPFIKTLLSVYERHTGRKGECIAIGGGTYVHDIENGVAFGAIMPDIDTRMHGANEFMPLDDLITAAKIYADVIIEICG